MSFIVSRLRNALSIQSLRRVLIQPTPTSTTATTTSVLGLTNLGLKQSPQPLYLLSTAYFSSNNRRRSNSDFDSTSGTASSSGSNPLPSKSSLDTSMADTQHTSQSRNVPIQKGTAKEIHPDTTHTDENKQNRNLQDRSSPGRNQQQMVDPHQQRSHRDNTMTDPSSWMTDFFTHPFGSMIPSFNNFNMPRQHISVDIVNNPTEVIVRAECPGVRKEDVKVSLDGDLLTISGERKSDNYEKSANYVRRECSYGSMSRSLRLPEDAQLDKIDAKYEDGVLNITLPRNPKATDESNRIKQVPIH